MKSKQTETRKPAPARKLTVPRKPAAHQPLPGNSHTELTPGELERMIATAAYLRAEKRGFSAGHELEDWVAAEREVRENLGSGPRRALQ